MPSFENYMLLFQDFKRGPAADVCAKVGLRIGTLHEWNEFTAAFQALDTKMEWRLPEVLRKLPGGSGETTIAQAILHAADYSHMADKLKGASTWTRLQYVSGEHVEAVAAAILRRN